MKEKKEKASIQKNSEKVKKKKEEWLENKVDKFKYNSNCDKM